jgi:hypothetical protein
MLCAINWGEEPIVRKYLVAAGAVLVLVVTPMPAVAACEDLP